MGKIKLINFSKKQKKLFEETTGLIPDAKDDENSLNEMIIHLRIPVSELKDNRIYLAVDQDDKVLILAVDRIKKIGVMP